MFSNSSRTFRQALNACPDLIEPYRALFQVRDLVRQFGLSRVQLMTM